MLIGFIIIIIFPICMYPITPCGELQVYKKCFPRKLSFRTSKHAQGRKIIENNALKADWRQMKGIQRGSSSGAELGRAQRTTERGWRLGALNTPAGDPGLAPSTHAVAPNYL